MKTLRVLKICLALMLMALAGCGSGTATPAAPAAPAPAPVLPPLTEAEMKSAEEFAKKMETTMSSGDPTFTESHVDYTAIQQEVTKNLQISAASLQAFMNGFKQSSVVKGICQVLQAGNKYKLLRVRQENGTAHALFRMLLGGQAANYHDYYLRPDGKGGWMIKDFYIYLTGEPLTLTLRRAILPLVAEENKNFLEKLTSSESDYIKHSKDIIQMQNLVKAGDAQQAMAIYSNLPPELQKEKNIMIARLSATQLLSQKTNDKSSYRATLDDFQKFFPNDPGLDLLLIDGHCLHKDYDKALACVDRINQSLGGDAHQVGLRANLYKLMNKDDKAKEAAKEAIAMEPDLALPYYVLLELSLSSKSYTETVQVLNNLEKNAGMTYPTMEKQELFADFIKSKEYRDWKQSRGKK
jgi:tetratricopeptide (TPR) repeat protein